MLFRIGRYVNQMKRSSDSLEKVSASLGSNPLKPVGVLAVSATASMLLLGEMYRLDSIRASESKNSNESDPFAAVNHWVPS